MWRFKPFMPKEQAGLEGRTIDIGNLKVHIRNVIAEGGFSRVYLAHDVVHPSRQYALKHIICNDEELLDLVMKEISVMKLLRGHPNVVALLADTILDMGRTKEALIVMEFCDKSLVNVLDSRGAGYFEEKQVLLIFRDVCNAVFAMHCLSPAIAHRDLKAENLLLGPDGTWKLCDFGSISTNHKRFERPEEMGIEEDNIRKHTTPAYRAPEMWDLFRRELINEKVDIWALGCLLYRICYFKSAFDGESKLQILNGNYRIPELPKYSSTITDLIKDMLQGSPDARPDITQVWFRVNGLLPEELQKSLPDSPADMHLHTAELSDGGILTPARKSAPMPRRSPPPPPPSCKEPVRNVSEPSVTSEAGGGPIGAFWSSQHVSDLFVTEEKAAPVHDEPRRRSLSTSRYLENTSSNLDRAQPPRNAHGNSLKKFADGPSEDFELRFFPDDKTRGPEKPKASPPESKVAFQNEAFNTFVADFDTSKLDSLNSNTKLGKEQTLEAEVDKLKDQLKQVNQEKDEMTSKYEKLSAICRSQRQEIQELKQGLAMKSPSPDLDSSKNVSVTSKSGLTQQREKIEGSVSELEKGMFNSRSPSPSSNQWKAFLDDPKSHPKSVRTTNGQQNKNAPSGSPGSIDNWDFGTDNFTAVPAGSRAVRTPGQGKNSQPLSGESKSKDKDGKRVTQPAGWAGF